MLPNFPLNHLLGLSFPPGKDVDEVEMVFEVCYEQHFYVVHKLLVTQSLFDMRVQLDVHSRTDVTYMLKPWHLVL